ADGVVDLREERGPVSLEVVEDRVRDGLRIRAEERRFVRQIQRDTAVFFPERLDAAPDDLAGCAERVEIARRVVVDARGEDLALEDRRRQRVALQRVDGIEQRVEAAALLRRILPARQEA